jgi:hypothetical protein
MSCFDFGLCSRRLLVLLLLFCGLAESIAVKLPGDALITQPSRRQVDNSQSMTCGFEGNPDIYGLGIRLGIYLQWIASCLSFHGRFNKRWPTGLVDVATVFEIAIFIATIVLVADPHATVYSVEIMLLILIFFGDFYFVQVGAVLSYRNFTGMFSLAGLFLRLLLCLAMLSLSVWFWFPGFDRFQQTPCGSYAFIFAKAPLSVGPVRKLIQALTCLHLLLWALPLSVPIVPLIGVVVMAFMILMIEAMLTDRNGKDGRLGFFASVASFWQMPLEDLAGDSRDKDEEVPSWDTDKGRRRRR